MNEQQILETLRDEPFGVEWSAWCHPETLRDLRDDCQSLRTKDDPIPPTPRERFGRDFVADPALPRDEFFVYPEDVTEFIDAYVTHPPRRLVEQLIERQGIDARDEDYNTVVTTTLWYSLEETRHEFDVDAIKDVERIPALRQLIERHVPDDHPPASPELVEWESTSDYLDVDVTDTTWRWTMDYTDSDVASRVQFSYRVAHRDLLEMHEDHVIGAMDAFARRAIDTVNSTETRELTGWLTEHSEPRIATEPDSGEISDVHTSVGEKTISYGDLYMQPRRVPSCR
jgi:hypothetical protein